MEQQIKRDGFVRFDRLVTSEELSSLRKAIYALLEGKIDTGTHRSDLAPSTRNQASSIESITQIMWPSHYIEDLKTANFFQKAALLAQQMLGSDMAHDFDMIFYKAPHTNAATPFHQDMAYWPDLPDRRALSCWVALDNTTVENGCLWFVAGTEKRNPLVHYVQDVVSGVLGCESSEAEATPVPLSAGDCTFHLGDTVHYSRGNSTAFGRAALVINFRPARMIKRERLLGFDHGLTRNVRLNRSALTAAKPS